MYVCNVPVRIRSDLIDVKENEVNGNKLSEAVMKKAASQNSSAVVISAKIEEEVTLSLF